MTAPQPHTGAGRTEFVKTTVTPDVKRRLADYAEARQRSVAFIVNEWIVAKLAEVEKLTRPAAAGDREPPPAAR